MVTLQRMKPVPDLTLRLTAEELDALDALAAGLSQIAEQQVEAEAAVAAAVDLGLTRLIDDFDLPDASVRDRVQTARMSLRHTWTRGNACL